MLERLTKIKTYPIRQSPIPAFKNKLKQYVDQLPLTDHIRQFLADETFIDQNPGYYTHYPFLFCKNVENAANLKHLTIAGFLYYKSVIILDDLFDNDKVKTQSFLIASICQEESIKILTSLFGLKSKFWSYLNQRKAEYSLAIKQDKDLILNTSLKAFEKQADCKSAFGDTWATGFILSYLHEFDTKNGLIRSNIQKGCNFLLNTKEDLLWGYNQSWIEDTDSSTFALLALSNHELFPIKSFHSWLSLQKSSGGFSTYFDEKALASSINKEIDYNVDGWIKDHVCVSAAALYLLSILKSDQSIDKQRLALINFIKKAQLSSGLWESYWWTSPIYSTTYIIKAATRLDDKALKNAVEKSLNGLFELQNSNGSFGDQFTEESPFYTGLVVEACCSSISYFEAFKNEIEIAVDWLRNNQTTDGTWKGTPALRMPSPEITTPEDISTWIEETKGLNIRVNEINRLFSTVVCTTSISKYYDISS
jgi:squalene cyclase